MTQITPLRAGPWSLDFDDGDLRDLRLDGRIVISRIYAAVRDEGWRTIGGRIVDLHVEACEDAFAISYRREHRAAGIAYDSGVRITGASDGRIAIAYRGVAVAAFSRQRIGLCVLHDQGLAGSPVRIGHAGGGSSEGVFPVLIAPHQPFHDVASLTVRLRPGREATVRFSGDVFETEDQRNWGDASFKTYSTPLARPRPVALAAGDVVEQNIEISATGAGMALAADFAPDLDPGLLHAWGIERLRAVVPVGADLAPLRRSPLPLDVVLHGPPASWPDLAALPLASVVALPGDRATTPTAWVHELRSRLPGLAIGGGNASQFTEFNRQRPDGSGWDVVDIPVDPYVHSVDQRSLADNVPAIAAIAASARVIMPGAELHLALAHGRHPEFAERHGGEGGRLWLRRVMDCAAAAGVDVLGLGPVAWLRPSSPA